MDCSIPKNTKLINHQKIDSTNEEAKRYLLANEALDDNDIVAITSNIQSHGKGRLGRVWQSEEGNLFLSLIVKPNCDFKDFGQLSFISSIALRRAICGLLDDTCQRKVTLKWPNDVLLDNKKVAGILLESLSLNSQLPNHIIIGIGVNIKSYPKDIENYNATCIKDFNDKVTRDIFLDKFLNLFNDCFKSWQQFGFADFKEYWQTNAKDVGHKISLNDGLKTISGIFKGINCEGEIILIGEDNKIMKFSSGEVSFS